MKISRPGFALIWTGFLSPIATLFSCSFSSKACKKLYLEASKNKYDLIIVPGVPFENLEWGRTMKARIYWSKFLFDEGIAKNIMYSGSSVYTPYTEAEIMALYAEAIGIQKQNIFTETMAEHSTENIYYSYKKAKLLGFKNIALASDPFQTKSLRTYVRKKIDQKVTLIPIVIDTLKKMEPSMIDPQIDYQQAFKQDFISIKKREGFWKRLRGTLGYNIDSTAYQDSTLNNQ
ncbi:MAG TPA: ElyC/SanA/YdcF family protein [Puia sp.]|nr:ElyC/SanA/YdcF family protein [Puia sp.]